MVPPAPPAPPTTEPAADPVPAVAFFCAALLSPCSGPMAPPAVCVPPKPPDAEFATVDMPPAAPLPPGLPASPPTAIVYAPAPPPPATAMTAAGAAGRTSADAPPPLPVCAVDGIGVPPPATNARNSLPFVPGDQKEIVRFAPPPPTAKPPAPPPPTSWAVIWQPPGGAMYVYEADRASPAEEPAGEADEFNASQIVGDKGSVISALYCARAADR